MQRNHLLLAYLAFLAFLTLVGCSSTAAPSPSFAWPVDTTLHCGQAEPADGSFLRAVHMLQTHLPLPAPVDIKHADLTDKHQLGRTRYFPREHRFEIYIEEAMPLYMQISVLCHEWAHGLSMPLFGPFHSAVWGVCFAATYQTVYGM